MTYGQHPKNCLVYQYEGLDSTKKIVTLKIAYNAKGQITSKKYTKNKHNDPTYHLLSGTYLYYYNDTLLVKQEHICGEHSSCMSCDGLEYDTTRSLYYFNDRKQLIKEQIFDYVRQRKLIDTTIYANRDEFAYELEKKGAWIKGNTVLSMYNDKGQKTLEYKPNKDDSHFFKYTWKYNKDGKLIKYSYLKGTRILYEDNYTYFINGYKFISNSPSYRGIKENSITTIVKLDNIGREIEKTRTLSDSDSLIICTRTFYNSSGLISRKISNDENGPMLSHIYVYEE